MDDLKELARAHNLSSITVTHFADSGKYSVSVQWMERGVRRCEFCDRHTDTPEGAIRSAITVMQATRVDSEDAKARRIAELREQLAALTGEAA